jgi:hypothetical protein
MNPQDKIMFPIKERGRKYRLNLIGKCKLKCNTFCTIKGRIICKAKMRIGGEIPANDIGEA